MMGKLGCSIFTTVPYIAPETFVVDMLSVLVSHHFIHHLQLYHHNFDLGNNRYLNLLHHHLYLNHDLHLNYHLSYTLTSAKNAPPLLQQDVRGKKSSLLIYQKPHILN